MSTAYGLSWVYGEFVVTRLKYGKCVDTWKYPEPVRDLSDFSNAVNAAAKALKMGGGSDIAIAYEADEHDHVFLNTPPMNIKDLEKFLSRRVVQEKKFEGQAAWGYRITNQTDTGCGVVLHIMPRDILEAVHRICKQNNLILRRLVALADVLTLHCAGQEQNKEKVSLQIALFDSQVQMIVMNQEGEANFVRELNFKWDTENMERLKLDLDRTLLYAKQRHSAIVESISFLGEDAERAAAALSTQFQVPVFADEFANSNDFWAITVSQLPRRISSNLMPPSMRRTITSQHLRKAGAWMAIAASISAMAIAVIVELLVAQYGKVDDFTIMQTEDLESQKLGWQVRYQELKKAETRYKKLNPEIPPIPLWFVRNLESVISDNVILNRVRVHRESDYWSFAMEGATKATLAESITILDDMESKLSTTPWNAQISHGTEDDWLKQLSEGRASGTGLISFNINGAMQ